MVSQAALHHPLFTVGHSNHEASKFIELLRMHEISAIADVRSQPFSAFTPQFNRDVLEGILKSWRIHYVFMGEELGARRSERTCYVSGQARYPLIAQLPVFQRGLDRIRSGVRSNRIAIMCSEKDPLTCHRAILVCRHLRGPDLEIQHILEDGSCESLAAAEDRLLAIVGLPAEDLFRGRGELTEEAYDRQGQAIAFTEPTPNAAVAS